MNCQPPSTRPARGAWASLPKCYLIVSLLAVLAAGVLSSGPPVPA